MRNYFHFNITYDPDHDHPLCNDHDLDPNPDFDSDFVIVKFGVVITTRFSCYVSQRTRQHAQPTAADVQWQGHLCKAQHIIEKAVRYQWG